MPGVPGNPVTSSPGIGQKFASLSPSPGPSAPRLEVSAERLYCSGLIRHLTQPTDVRTNPQRPEHPLQRFPVVWSVLLNGLTSRPCSRPGGVCQIFPPLTVPTWSGRHAHQPTYASRHPLLIFPRIANRSSSAGITQPNQIGSC